MKTTRTARDVIFQALTGIEGQNTYTNGVISDLAEAGFVVVPKEPTPAMLFEGQVSTTPQAYGEGGTWLDGENVQEIYRAMLAEAPKASQ